MLGCVSVWVSEHMQVASVNTSVYAVDVLAFESENVLACGYLSMRLVRVKCVHERARM